MIETNMEQDELKNRLIMSVVSLEKNRDSLNDYPYLVKGNFAVLTQLLAGPQNKQGQYTAYLTVTKDMQRQWDISVEELFQLAKENSKRLFPGKILSMEEFIGENSIEVQIDGTAAPEVYVLSNEKYFNGAATIFYEENMLEQLSEHLAGKNLVLFPAGNNEIYAVATEESDLAECQEVYDSFLAELDSDCLGPNVLLYDSSEKNIKTLNNETFEVSLLPEMNRDMEERISRNERRR